MRKFLLFLIFPAVIVGTFLIPQRVFAQGDQNQQTYATGIVSQIVDQTEVTLKSGDKGFTEQIKVKEDLTGITRDISIGSQDIPVNSYQLYKVGQHVIISSQPNENNLPQYFITDQYRIPALIWLTIGFFITVLLVSRVKGFSSLLGMLLSLAVILFFMVPQIINGANPVLISVLVSGIISAIIIYFGHGFHYRSHVALFCMLATLAFVGLLSHFVVQWAYLSGAGEETASYLQYAGLKTINLQGLFLGGIILAALSVLDDSVISQVSVIYQLKEVKPDISVSELFKRGMEVGKDHISTLVNTLILAYAGASLPLFILFTINSGTPAWVSLNDQMVAEEIVRTITGSIGLVLSIPLTTLIAAYVVHRLHKTTKDKRAFGHEHIH